KGSTQTDSCKTGEQNFESEILHVSIPLCRTFSFTLIRAWRLQQHKTAHPRPPRSQAFSQLPNDRCLVHRNPWVDSYRSLSSRIIAQEIALGSRPSNMFLRMNRVGNYTNS